MDAKRVPRNTITYSATISACEKGGEWQEALRLFNEMDGKRVPRDTITYNATISACEKGGEWQEALRLFNEMDAKRVPRNPITYSATISACEKGGQCKTAMDLLSDMELLDLLPNQAELQRSTIDFHGFTFPVAKLYLLKHLEEKMIRRIVVGKGHHSCNGPVLKREIMKLLREEKYQHVLNVKEDEKNNGCLNITYLEN